MKVTIEGKYVTGNTLENIQAAASLGTLEGAKHHLDVWLAKPEYQIYKGGNHVAVLRCTGIAGTYKRVAIITD